MESPSRRSFPDDTPHGASRGRAVVGGAGATGAGVALEQDLTRARPPGGDAAASRIASFAVAVEVSLPTTSTTQNENVTAEAIAASLLALTAASDVAAEITQT